MATKIVDTAPILQYVRDWLLDDPKPIRLETSLFQTQLLDSMKLVELIQFLEKHYQICIIPADVAIENLDSIEKIGKFIQRKRALDL